MDELEELIEQKRQIEDRIRILKGYPMFKRFKVGVETYPTGKAKRYFLAIKYFPLDDGRPKYQTLFSSHTRQGIIEEIPSILEELQGLYDLTKDNK